MAAINVIPPTIKDCGFFLNRRARLAEKEGFGLTGVETSVRLSNKRHTSSYIESSMRKVLMSRKKMDGLKIKLDMMPEKKPLNTLILDFLFHSFCSVQSGEQEFLLFLHVELSLYIKFQG